MAAAGAAGAAAGGMSPLGWGGLALGGLGALGGLAGMMSGGPNYQKMIDLLRRNYGPQQLMQGTQQLYQQGLGSPGFQNQLIGINQASNQFNQNLAARNAGMGQNARFGVGTAAQAAAPGLSSYAKGQAYGGLQQNSQAQMLQMLMGQMQALQGMNPGQGFGQNFGNLLGAGMQAGGQYLGYKAMGR